LITQYVCRLLNYMDRHAYVECRPQRPDNSSAEQPVINLSSGYVQRAVDTLPRQGARKPWRTYQNYVRDVFNFRLSRLNDGTMRFARPTARTAATARSGAAS
jgi:hypothetical protein